MKAFRKSSMLARRAHGVEEWASEVVDQLGELAGHPTAVVAELAKAFEALELRTHGGDGITSDTQ
ncbi:MAG: hypothetical protein AMXMBFR56_55340 [Polyangiaceae bacterium]